MSQASDRTLYILDYFRNPECIDHEAYECGFLFWCECTILVPTLDGESVVTADDAAALAERIERNLPTLGWARDFAAFLRGGGFSVVTIGNFESQN
jgi:hypothetical protein